MTPDTDRLARLGWNRHFADAFDALGEPDLVPARICVEHNHLFRVYTASSDVLASAAGRLKHIANAPSALPAVGDWVGIRPTPEGPAPIRAILPRTTCFSRKAAGDTTKRQVVAANIDTVFLVSGLDGDFNPRRIQRYLVAASDSGAVPVIVLNKGDLAEDLEAAVTTLREMAADVPIHVTSCEDGRGIDALARYLTDGHTVALLGSSGVGKSTLINRLLGYDRQRTRTVRPQDRGGRHTTVHRELLLHPDSGVIIDTPGMRELRLWDTRGGLETTFDDIEALVGSCRFRDCQHRTEPGCAVRQAVTDGKISAGRLTCYHQLHDEQTTLDRRRDELAQLEETRPQKRTKRASQRAPKR